MKRIKTILLSALALVMLTGGMARADVWGTDMHWPDKEVDARIELWCDNADPDNCQSIFWFGDFGVDNVDHVYIDSLRMYIDDSPGGPTPRIYREYGPAPVNIYTDIFDIETPWAACLHPVDYPNAITFGDEVWSRVAYRIYWNNGNSTSLLVDVSPHVVFTSHSQCT